MVSNASEAALSGQPAVLSPDGKVKAGTRGKMGEPPHEKSRQQVSAAACNDQSYAHDMQHGTRRKSGVQAGMSSAGKSDLTTSMQHSLL